jgi:hypothetical protein
LVTEGLRQASEGVKEKLQYWRLPSWIILYLSFRPFVNQSFCESRFGSLSHDWVTLRVRVLVSVCVIVLRSLSNVPRTHKWEAQSPADLKWEHKLVHHQIYILHALYFIIFIWDSVSFNQPFYHGILKN